MARWSKGTTDHDGDGQMGGSRPADRSDKGRETGDPSRSDQAPDPEKGDTTMAKAPTNKTEAPKAPAQPWAKPTDTATAPAEATTGGAGAQTGEGAAEGNGGGASEAETVITSTADVPTSDVSDIVGDDDDLDIHDTADQAAALAENDVALTGTKELPSFVRDQVSPSGTDIALEVDRSLKPTLERSAYPSLGERLYSMLGKASPELMAEFEERMADLAQTVIDDLRASDVSREFNARVIDGTAHYGPRVRNPEVEPRALSANNVEANRRARRAAERLAAASKPGK